MQDKVYIPLAVLKQALDGVRAHDAEKRQLEARIDANNRRVVLLKGKTFEIDQQLTQYKTNHRQSVTPQSSSKLMLASSMAINNQLSHQSPTRPSFSPSSSTITKKAPRLTSSPHLNNQLAAAKDRVVQLEHIMKLVKEIATHGELKHVVTKILQAAQTFVKADTYTLGVMNERRNILEIYSTVGPLDHSKPPEIRIEGVVGADSATTFGRVVLTGNALEIQDFYPHENYDAQLKTKHGQRPRALLSLPIRNAHGSVVGVLQVVWLHPTSPGKHNNNSKSPPKPSRSSDTCFTTSDRKHLEFLTVVAGSSIWNLVLSRERQTAQSRIEGLLKLHRNISMEAVSSVVLDQVLSVCHELIGTERIGLFMKMDGDDELYIASAADIVKGEYVPITKGIVGHVARTGETIITNDAYSHSMFDPTLDQKTGFVTKRILCLPVQSPDGTILAVISAVNKVDNTDFTSEDAVFLKYAADAVGISLHKSSLHHEVKTSQKLIEARLKLTTFISESSDIAAFVDLVMGIGRDIMECDRFGLLLIDHFKKELWITPTVGGESIRTPMNRGISGLVATTGQVVCTRDAYRHELFDSSVDLKTGYKTTSVLCMPIWEDHATTTDPKVVAVAMCINKKEGSHVVAFNQTDRKTMERYCREVQFALGRLSLDISYYKVVSDCIAGVNAVDNASETKETMRENPNFSETDIISSIVHKYCSGAAKATGADTTPSSIASVVPALLRKKQEDDAIPFPREIVFTTSSSGSGASGASTPSYEELLERWDTDTLPMTTTEIGLYCSHIFRAYGFFEAFHISLEKFHSFTTNVANYYRANRFHNLQHAFQVLMATHMMIKSECRKFFSGIEIFSLFLAALCHDIDHPGNTNDFELKTLSAMALTHNDDAVLERHHCRVTFIILNHKSAKILQHLDEARYKRVRQLIIACILATDMSKHFEKCKALESLTRRQLSEKRSLLMGIIIHAADLSFQTLPFKQAYEWGSRLLDEFQNQAKVEAEQGIATDFFMQNLDNVKTRLIVQLNFINYVVRPIWLPLTSLCHHLRFYTESLEQNFEQYRSRLEEIKLKEATEAKERSTAAPTASAVSPSTEERVTSPHYASSHLSSIFSRKFKD